MPLSLSPAGALVLHLIPSRVIRVSEMCTRLEHTQGLALIRLNNKQALSLALESRGAKCDQSHLLPRCAFRRTRPPTHPPTRPGIIFLVQAQPLSFNSILLLLA
jgi:hypothetical protein